jgi:predicted nucleic acid-binding protein
VFVLDASVLVEFAIDGEHRASADRLLDRFETDEFTVFVTAAHGLLETTHTIRRLVRRGRLEARDGQHAVTWLGDLDVFIEPPNAQLDRIWELRDSMTAYDAAYAATAESFELPLVTVDERLLRACAAAGIAAVHLGQAA